MADQYDRMTTAQLEKAAELRGVDLSSASTNAERADLLRQADETGSEETSGVSTAPVGASDTPGATPEGGEGPLEPQEDQRLEQPLMAGEGGGDQVLEVEEVQDKGFFGHNPDPVPNEEYTFAGQASKLQVLDETMVPTPEEEGEEESE